MNQPGFEQQRYPAFLALGFRPFFMVALLSAIILGALWAVIYSFNSSWLREDYPFISWHAHEMIFGYTVAVISGFLLTAVRNWTDVQTIRGLGLLCLVLLWIIGRLIPFIPAIPLWYLAIHELLFLGLVLFAAVLPVLRTNQWRQLFIFGLLGLLVLASLLFHLGLIGVVPFGSQLGLYLGLYVIIALILAMGRRVIPGFIENAIGGGFQARNKLWLDNLSRGVFLLFVLFELYALTAGDIKTAFISGLLALVLGVLHLWRLLGWHHRELWLHPLLWSLYLAYGWIALGFLLKFLVVAINLNPWAAIHAFTYGGIGLITAGMMVRVTLGHTGRNVFAPPASIGVWLGVIFAGSILRVIVVLLWPDEYQMLILASQILWIVGFSGLMVVLGPMLLKPRVDGRPE